MSKGLAMEQLPLYWFGSGTPTYFIEVLNKFGALPSPIGGNEAVAADFDAPTERMESITPLLYQSGYVTIKGYDEMFQIYTQDIPNAEVRIGLMRSLIPYYVTRALRMGGKRFHLNLLNDRL